MKTNLRNFEAVMRILICEIIVGYAVKSTIVECWKPQIITDEIFLKWIRILKKWFKITRILSASQLFESFSIENVYFDGIALIIRYGIWFTMSLVRHVPFGVGIAIYLFLNAKVHLSTHEKSLGLFVLAVCYVYYWDAGTMWVTTTIRTSCDTTTVVHGVEMDLNCRH